MAQGIILEAEIASLENLAPAASPEQDRLQGFVQLKGVRSSMTFPNVLLGSEKGSVVFIRFSCWDASERKGVICAGDHRTELVFKGMGSWLRYTYLPVILPPVPPGIGELRLISGEKNFPRIDHIEIMPIQDDPLFILSSDSLEFLPIQGSVRKIDVRCNGSWKVLETPDWVTALSVSGEYSGELIFKTIGAERSGAERSGKIQIQFNNREVVSVFVRQPVHERHTYYLDQKAGNDSYTGLHPDSAWRSLDKIHSLVLGPGDSVLFRNGGQWIGPFAPTGSGSPEACIVFSNYGDSEDKRPLVHAGGTDQAVILKNMGNVIFENFRLTNPADLPERRARGVYIFADQSKTFENITIRGNEIYQVIGWVKQSRRFSSGAIFTDTEGDRARFEYLVIENNWIHDCTTRGITGNAGASNWTDTSSMHNHVWIRGNLIDNMGCDGIRTIASRNVMVENNRIFRVGHFTKGVDPLYIAACFPQQCGSTTWQFNEIAYTAPTHPSAGDMDSQAFDIDHDCAGTHLFQYNYSHDNTGGFFLLMGKSIQGEELTGFKRAVIRYNISLNDGGSFPRIFELHDFKDVEMDVQVYNNLFSFTGISEVIQAKGGSFRGIRFLNNIFYGNSGSYSPEVELTNNLYYSHFPPAHDTSGHHADPEFRDAGAVPEGMELLEGYQIMDGSPAGNAGCRVESNGGRDFWGNPVPEDLPVSIGPHQLTAATDISSSILGQKPLNLQILPMSCRGSFSISYTISEPTPVWIQVVDLRGEILDTIKFNRSDPGVNEVEWNPVRSTRSSMSPGYYLCSLQSSFGSAVAPFLIH